MPDTYTRDHMRTLGLLLMVAILMHAANTLHVRPVAAGLPAQEQGQACCERHL